MSAFSTFSSVRVTAWDGADPKDFFEHARKMSATVGREVEAWIDGFMYTVSITADPAFLGHHHKTIIAPAIRAARS